MQPFVDIVTIFPQVSLYSADGKCKSSFYPFSGVTEELKSFIHDISQATLEVIDDIMDAFYFSCMYRRVYLSYFTICTVLNWSIDWFLVFYALEGISVQPAGHCWSRILNHYFNQYLFLIPSLRACY